MMYVQRIVLLSVFIPFAIMGMQVGNRFECNGIFYTKNNFGDICPEWQNIPIEQLTDKLSLFVQSLKDEVHNKPFFVEIPHEQGIANSHVKKAGFTLYYANDTMNCWTYKNGFLLPDPYNSVTATQILITEDDKVLVTEETTRKGLLCFPAGTSNIGELLENTAVREIQEELGLIINPSHLKLFALRNRTKANRFGANCVDYYYKVNARHVQGELQLDPKEIIRTVWASLQDIAEGKDIDGLKNTQSHVLLAKHLLDKRKESKHITLLDYRQLSKPEHLQDKNDVMTFDLVKK